MAMRNLRTEGDDILLKRSRPVEKFDRRLWDLLDDMGETLAHYNGVGLAAVQTAETLEAACIVAPTMSGRTARLISNLRPRMPIYAVTPFARVMRQMQLSWGVVPLHDDVRGDMRRVMEQSERAVVAAGLVEPGDLAVFTAGDPSTGPVEAADSHYFGTTPANVMYVVQIRGE